MKADLQMEVQNLNARYADAIDESRFEAWPDFFTPQGHYRIITAEDLARGLPLALIYATSRAMLRDRVRSLRDANVYEAQLLPPCDWSTGYHVGERLRGARETSFMVARIMHTGETMLFASGYYRDHILLDPQRGEAYFAEKVVILDSRLIDTLLAIPL